MKINDGHTPFDRIRAEDLGEELHSFYEPLEQLLRKVSGVDITGSRSVFLVGGRGTGKTMVLKYLSFKIQLLKHLKVESFEDAKFKNVAKKEMSELLTSLDYLGIYIKFKTSEYDKLRGELSELFEPYFSMKFSEKIVEVLIILKQARIIDNEQELKICLAFLSDVVQPLPREITSLEQLHRYIQEDVIMVYERIFALYAHYSFLEIKKSSTIPVIIAKNIFYKFPKIISEAIPELNGKRFFLLLDELEYLSDQQKTYIGRLIKDSDGSPLEMKIGTRYLPDKIYVGNSNEVLKEPHDFRCIDIVECLNYSHSGKSKMYEQLITKILNRRLEKSSEFCTKGISNIETLFPKMNIEKDALRLVKGRKKHWKKFEGLLKNEYSLSSIETITAKFENSEKPLLEKLNMMLYYRGVDIDKISNDMKQYEKGKNAKYRELYNKHKYNLLFQLYNDYSTEFKYHGIDTIIHLSSGIIRNALELCNSALNIAYDFNYTPSDNDSIDMIYQDKGIKNYSRLEFEDILRIPKYGLEAQLFINQIGNIFRQLHLDKCLVEPERIHFETDYIKLTNEEKQIFDCVVQYYYLQKKPAMDAKNIYQIKSDDYILNKIFSPYFNISYRVRGRTFISPEQIRDLIVADKKKKEATRKEVVKANVKGEKSINSKLFEEEV